MHRLSKRQHLVLRYTKYCKTFRIIFHYKVAIHRLGTCKHTNTLAQTNQFYKTFHIKIYLQRALNAYQSIEEHTLNKVFLNQIISRRFIYFTANLERKQEYVVCIPYTKYVILVLCFLINRFIKFFSYVCNVKI